MWPTLNSLFAKCTAHVSVQPMPVREFSCSGVWIILLYVLCVLQMSLIVGKEDVAILEEDDLMMTVQLVTGVDLLMKILHLLTLMNDQATLPPDVTTMTVIDEEKEETIITEKEIIILVDLLLVDHHLQKDLLLLVPILLIAILLIVGIILHEEKTIFVDLHLLAALMITMTLHCQILLLLEHPLIPVERKQRLGKARQTIDP